MGRTQGDEKNQPICIYLVGRLHTTIAPVDGW